MRKLLFALLLPMLLLCGCNKQDSVTYTGLEAGTIENGVFISDSFTRMNIVGNEGKFDVHTNRRVLVSFQTRPMTDSNRIDIDLLGLWESTSLAPVPAESLPGGPDGSPLQVSDAWFAAGYLNILASYTAHDESLHTLDAVYSASESAIVIRLRHDGTQDTAKGDKVVDLFLCIPMDEPIASYDQQGISSGKKQGSYPASVLLQWTSYTQEGGPLTLFEREGSFTPSASKN